MIDHGDFDMVLVIGPEGGKYAAPFEMLRLPVTQIHIDDFDKGRPYKVIGNLEELRGRRILLLEDDVHSGSTLNRTLSLVLPFEPEALDLFLGNPIHYQNLENVPKVIRNIYTNLSYPKSSEEEHAIYEWFLKLAGAV
ncbi:MAG: hypothetical protein ABIE74_10835 [Pseudomonadota bacterium]